MPYLNFNGARLHYEIDGAGPPLLLVMGLGGNSQVWAPIRRQLASRFRLIMYDMQGTGRSDASSGPTTRDTLLGEVDALLTHLDFPRVLAIGYSFGTSVLLNYAKAKPERVQAISLVSGVYNVTPFVRCFFDVQTELADSVTRSQYLKQVLLWLFSDAFLNRNPDFFERIVFMLARSPHASQPFQGWRQFVSSFDSDYRKTIDVLSLPIQIVHGEGDKISPVGPVRDVAAANPRCRLDVVPEGGHMLTWDSPEATTAALVDFLENHGRTLAPAPGEAALA